VIRGVKLKRKAGEREGAAEGNEIGGRWGTGVFVKKEGIGGKNQCRNLCSQAEVRAGEKKQLIRTAL